MSLKGLLAELQRDYLASFPAKIDNIGALWETGNLSDLLVEFHKLKGTGRTYGIPEVSQIGQALEALCEMKHPALNQAVPAALYLLEQVRSHRTTGRELKLDEQKQFQIIVQLLVETKTG